MILIKNYTHNITWWKFNILVQRCNASSFFPCLRQFRLNFIAKAPLHIFISVLYQAMKKKKWCRLFMLFTIFLNLPSQTNVCSQASVLGASNVFLNDSKTFGYSFWHFSRTWLLRWRASTPLGNEYVFFFKWKIIKWIM